MLSAPCNTGAVNWPAPTPGATGVAFILTNDRDTFSAANWTNPTDGLDYLAVWDGDADGIHCWNSFDPAFTPTPFTSAATTWISVDARDESDDVRLDPMTAAAFPALNTGTTQTVSGGLGLDFITGSWADDLLIGGPDQDTIYGKDGHDEIRGLDGHDYLYGEQGNDTITGGNDTDRIYGGPGTDTISGNDQFDFLYGEGDNDTISGDDGNDYLSGGAGNDTLNGNLGQDFIEGNAGNDTIDGGDLADVLYSNAAGMLIDQPWNGVGGTAGWFDMSDSGPDTDGDCDVEDLHSDDEAGVCAGSTVAANDDLTYSVSHKGTLSVAPLGVMANDTYAGAPAPIPTVSLIHVPLHDEAFTITLSNGAFDYDSVDAYVGKDFFTYSLTQGAATSKKPGVVIIDVTNGIPAAVNDSLITAKNTPKTQNLVGNDTDSDKAFGEQLFIDSVTQPPAGQGTVSFVAGSDSVTYTPPLNWTGSTSFTYKVKDEIGAVSQNPATVNVSVWGMPLMLDLAPAENAADAPTITDADLALLAGEAARRWVMAGVDPATARQALAETQFVVADLPGSMLGMEMSGQIVIDVNAAGYGWFVDATPSLDEEFSIFVSASEQQAGRGSAALGRADLLTALMHEFGHTLGMVHLEGGEFEHSVMHDTLGLSMRRVPTAADYLAADEFYASLGEGSTGRRRR